MQFLLDGTDGNVGAAGLQCVTPMMTSIAKVVQPTATVSSVPVSGPSKFRSFEFLAEFLIKSTAIIASLIGEEEIELWGFLDLYVSHHL